MMIYQSIKKAENCPMFNDDLMSNLKQTKNNLEQSPAFTDRYFNRYNQPSNREPVKNIDYYYRLDSILFNNS
jgi:hypothetical protein